MSEIFKYLNMVKIANDDNISIKKRVYKIMRKYNLSYATIFSLFGIGDESESRAIYLKRLYFQFIKEEMK